MSLMTRQGRKLFVHFHPLTTLFLFANAIMLLVVLAKGGFDLDVLLDLGAIYPPFILGDDQWYRLVTAMFLHGSLIHFLGNSLVLYYLGSHLERLLGSVKYTILYMVSGISSSLAVIYFGNQNTITIGASGALFGVIGALLVLTFAKPTWFAGSSIRQIRQLVIINLVLTFAIENISVAGHIGGLLSGIALIYFLIPKNPDFLIKINRMREQQMKERQDRQGHEDPWVS